MRFQADAILTAGYRSTAHIKVPCSGRGWTIIMENYGMKTADQISVGNILYFDVVSDGSLSMSPIAATIASGPSHMENGKKSRIM